MQRNVMIAVIPYTSSSDESAMTWAMGQAHNSPYNVITHNCSTMTGQALKAGGIPVDPTSAPGDMFNQVSGLPGVQVYNLSPGDAPPTFLSQFNKN
jgi:hypothetical protein